jgi:hypothetical protein
MLGCVAKHTRFAATPVSVGIGAGHGLAPLAGMRFSRKASRRLSILFVSLFLHLVVLSYPSRFSACGRSAYNARCSGMRNVRKLAWIRCLLPSDKKP